MLALLALVIPLGLDTFALALALGAIGISARDRLRITLVFALFEGGMPIVGLALGGVAGRVIGSAAEVVAAVGLIGVGAMLLREDDDEQVKVEKLPSARGFALAALGVSVALDELAVGFAFGLAQTDARVAVAAIIVQAVIVAQLGMRLGARLSEAWGERAAKLAGLVLIGYGMVLLLGRLT